MKLLIHDVYESHLSNEIVQRFKPDKIIDSNLSVRACLGCFGCWIKTPGKCVIQDDITCMGEILGQCDEVIIVSQLQYGCYSPFIKNILDRSIPYLLPWFTIREGQMHHQDRYKNRFTLNVLFYGKSTLSSKKTAQKLVKANALNLNVKYKITFEETIV